MMDIRIRSDYADTLENFVQSEVEEIAGQIVGRRITFGQPHDMVFQFANGSLSLEKVDLLIFIMPDQFYCYQGEELAATVVLEGNQYDLDLRCPGNKVPGRAFLRSSQE